VILVNLAAATESFIYSFAAASVVALRLKDRDRGRPYKMWGGLVLPGATAVLFGILAVGVFAQAGFECWGAGIILIVVAALWWVYIEFYVLPKLTKSRAEAAAKRLSRRPKAPEQAG
jgi:amino acid transporter